MDRSAPLQQLLIVTGPTGSGVSTVLQGLAHRGWMTVDNLSPAVLAQPAFISGLLASGQSIALGLQGSSPDKGFTSIHWTEAFPMVTLTLLALTASAPVLAGRTSAYTPVSSPPSPLGRGTFRQEEGEGLLPSTSGRGSDEVRGEGIKGLDNKTDYVLDTSRMSVEELWAKVGQLLEGTSAAAPMLTLCLQSFAFKRGVPLDADWVLDVRFLPNPFYDPALKALTGLDPAVSQFVFAHPDSAAFFDGLTGLLLPTLPLYQQQGRARVTVAIGCTGGKHRSVAMVERLAGFVKSAGMPYPISVHHRETPYWQQPVS
jgi:RNase adapter protein RapZ